MVRPLRDDAVAALTVRTVAVTDPGVGLTDLLPEPDGLAWVRRGEGLVGWGRAITFRGSGADRFADAEEWWHRLASHTVVRDEVDAVGSGLVAFGSFAFADDTAASSVLTVPSVVVGHRGSDWWITTIAVDGALPPPPPALRPAADVRAPGTVSYADGARSSAAWEDAVSTAVSRIRAGELDKVVLARDVDVRTTEPLDPRWVLRRLATRYESCYTFAVDGLLGATPELLVRLERRLATSRVLAGTIRRTGSSERDEATAGSLARSSKDLEEHEYAVASVSSALARHCTGMHVPEAPFVLHLPNVMHLATDITGVVSDSSTSLGLASELHPSAAVCGTPREAAQATLTQLEGMDRGRYAGPVGWLSSDGDGEWGIALRSGELDPNDPRHLRIFAGCGIVAGSQPEKELAESNDKLRPMRDALAAD